MNDLQILNSIPSEEFKFVKGDLILQTKVAEFIGKENAQQFMITVRQTRLSLIEAVKQKDHSQLDREFLYYPEYYLAEKDDLLFIIIPTRTELRSVLRIKRRKVETS